jgi:putative FmdB family regulatory protein
MPVFDYSCSECGKPYDIYHKVREVAEDVICPHCGSAKHKKLFSAATVSIGGSASSSRSGPPCEMGGGCCGGACGLN